MCSVSWQKINSFTVHGVFAAMVYLAILTIEGLD